MIPNGRECAYTDAAARAVIELTDLLLNVGRNKKPADQAVCEILTILQKLWLNGAEFGQEHAYERAQEILEARRKTDQGTSQGETDQGPQG